jgi:hypothetical protein
MVLKSTKMADGSFATADLMDAIKGLDTIECGEEARKHFNFAPSYRNLNHGMSFQMVSWSAAYHFWVVHRSEDIDLN